MAENPDAALTDTNNSGSEVLQTPEKTYLEKGIEYAKNFLEKAGYAQIDLTQGWVESKKIENRASDFASANPEFGTDNPRNFLGENCQVNFLTTGEYPVVVNIAAPEEGQTEPTVLIRSMNKFAMGTTDTLSDAVEWVQLKSSAGTEKAEARYRMYNPEHKNDRRRGSVIMKTGEPAATAGPDIDEVVKFDSKDPAFLRVHGPTDALAMNRMRRAMRETVAVDKSDTLSSRLVFVSVYKNPEKTVQGFALNANKLMKEFGTK